MTDVAAAIAAGEGVLGIELGSTRIKAVLIGPDNAPLATGGFAWENEFVDQLWTYRLDTVWQGVREAYADLAANVQKQYGVQLTKLASLGISAMMHGYLVFDAHGTQLTAFRTWRNTNTGVAAAQLTELFNYNIPHRWSIAQLWQSILDGDDYVGRITNMTTLAGYVHWKLSGEFVLGIDDASGMMPVDSTIGDFYPRMLEQFDELASGKGMPWKVRDLLPKVLKAGEDAGRLTETGAQLLDPSGTLQAGVPMCPPEGDAGTGMVATNSVAPGTGNISAGTSIFAMVVLEHELSKLHTEIDLVMTPSGDPVAMVHCNNGTTDLNDWVGLFADFAARAGVQIETGALYELLYRSALEGAVDGGKLLAYNYAAGEPIAGTEKGVPLVLRAPDADLNLPDFMRTHLMAAFGTIKLGMNILTEDEGIRLDAMFGHGGLFKTEGVAQRVLAAALDTPVTVGSEAGEGGAWGVALLAKYLLVRERYATLAEFLTAEVFTGGEFSTITASQEEVEGYARFMRRYVGGIPAEKVAAEADLF